MMSTYIEIPVEDIELDKSNPRIARGIAYYGENITSETMALLLGSTSEACASLRESIRENGGIIHPIVVNKRTGNSYVVIEGNTRLQIYKDFIKNGVPGNWTTIRAIVYDNLDTERIHAIRLQAHLIGPREWDPYSKAMYLHYLADVEHMSIIVDWINHSIENSFMQGAFYSTCITLLAPFLVEFFVDYKSSNRSKKVEKYTAYKGLALLICFVVIILLCIFYATAAKTNRIIQILSAILAGAFSLYLYLVSKMDSHSTLLTNYEDISYIEAEQNELDKMTTEAKNLKSVEVAEGVEVKL